MGQADLHLQESIVDPSPRVVDRTGNEAGVDVGPTGVGSEPVVGSAEDLVEAEWRMLGTDAKAGAGHGLT